MVSHSILRNSDFRRNERTGSILKVRGEFSLPQADTTEDAIKGFLQQNADELRLPLDFRRHDLRVIQDVKTPVRRVVRLQQTQDGIPVFGAIMTVQLDKNQRVKQLDLNHESQVQVALPQGDTKLTAEAAKEAASKAIGQFDLRKEIAPPEEVYYPTDDGLRRAYLVLILTQEPPHDWRVIVDAYSSEILAKDDLIVFMPNGQGLVFDPNPVVTSGNNTFRDPTATPSCGYTGTAVGLIDNQRVLRQLRDITFADGKYKLEGPYVKLRNFGEPNLAPPEEANPNDFNYSSTDDRFEAVMVYYHIDTLQRYIQSLGITTANNRQIEADAHDGSGPAYYSPADKGLHFSDSGLCRPDRAEDGEVMFHEYGHAIQDNQVPGWGSLNPVTERAETRAMGEGFGDILACVYFAPEHPFQREVFEDWIFADQGGLRRVDGTKVYPTDWAYQEHGDGEIWSAALWNIYRTIGGDSLDQTARIAARDVLLKTLILSHHSLLPSASMPDGAEAVMEVNAELEEYRGKHLMQMLDSFHDRGLLRCSPNADLYIRDDEGDPGIDAFVGPTFWNSPDLWIRNSDDGSTKHQNPEFGQDNWFYARVRNRGTETAKAFVVTFNVKPWAGTQFVYPNDFVPYISAAVGFNLAPGASTIVKAKWPTSLVPPAGTHACWLASVYTPVDASPVGRHVWEHNNLAQKNLTVVDMQPNDVFIVPFQFGSQFLPVKTNYRLEVRRSANWTNLPVSIVHSNPKVLGNIFHAVEQIDPVVLKPVIQPSTMLRFLEPSEVELVHQGLDANPVRFSLSSGSMLNMVQAQPPLTAKPVNIQEFLQRQAVLTKDPSGNAVIVFRPGKLSGFPITVEPRSSIKVGLKLTAPPEAKPGDVIMVDLIQRNEQGEVVGGISVQMNIR
jgi:hypothetical protein